MTQEQLPISEIVNSKWYVEIKDRITGFCKFIESESELTGSTYLIKLREHLELLYQAGNNLDWVDLKSNIDFDLFIDDKEYRELLNMLSEKLGANRFYWRTWTNQTKTLCEDLVDDVGDIYKDLKHSLLTLELNTEESIENAIWQIKFDFNSHWGDHCMNALYGIHYFLKK